MRYELRRQIFEALRTGGAAICRAECRGHGSQAMRMKPCNLVRMLCRCYQCAIIISSFCVWLAWQLCWNRPRIPTCLFVYHKQTNWLLSCGARSRRYSQLLSMYPQGTLWFPRHLVYRFVQMLRSFLLFASMRWSTFMRTLFQSLVHTPSPWRGSCPMGPLLGHYLISSPYQSQALSCVCRKE